VIDNGQQVRTGRFEYDPAGRATRWLVHGQFAETWHLDGIASPELHTLGHWSVDDDFVIPGDITSRIRTYRGQNLLVTGPRGMVARNAGLLVFDWDESTVLAIHGRQDGVADFEAFFASVCDAFGA
jgi:hypothetical protein